MTEKNRKLKRWLSTSLKFLLAGGLIVWMMERGSLDFSLLLHLTHPAYLAPCFLALFLNLYINNYRWVVLMRGQGFQLGIKETLPLSLIGLFFNYAMPGGVGGDLVKGFYIMQLYPQRRTSAATGVLIDRIVGLFGMVVMSLVALGLNLEMINNRPELKSLAVGVVALFLAFSGFFLFAFSKRIYGHPLVEKFFLKLPAGAKVRKIYEAVHSYTRQVRYFWLSLGLTLISQITMLAFFIFIGWAIDIEQVSVLTYAFAVPLGMIAAALPISPAGIGVGQAVFLVLFNWSLGHETPLGPSLITAHQLVSFVLGLTGAYFYFKRKKPNFEEATT